MRNNIICATALDKVDNIFLSEIFLDCLDCIQNNQQLLTSLHLFLWMLAVITISTIFNIIFFTKVMQKHFPSTNWRFCIGCCFLQKLSADILLCNRLTLHKLLQFLQVFSCIESNAHTFSAITTSTAGFLIVSLQTLWDIVMNYEANVRFVNTHSEGYSSYNHIDFLHKEIILCLWTGCRIKTCMIRCCLDFISLQYFGKFLNLLSR